MNFLLVLTFSVLISFCAVAKTIDQKKEELKKIFEAGGISKVEYEKSIKFLENKENKENKNKKFTLGNKKNKKKDEEEKITLEKIEELGQIVKMDDSYFPKGMIKAFIGCNNSFKCKGDKAGSILYKTFTRSKSFGQKNPGKMIKAMAMYEVFYAKKLYETRKPIKRYKENKYKKGLFVKNKKKNDEKKIRSLFGINDGRKK